jgi:hypothetical protein
VFCRNIQKMKVSCALACAAAATVGTATAFQSGDLFKSTFKQGGHFRAFTFDGTESTSMPLYYGDFQGFNRGTSDLKLDAIIHSNDVSADKERVSWYLIDDQLSYALKRKGGKGGEAVLLDEGCMQESTAVHALPPYRLLARAFDKSFPVAKERAQKGPSPEVSELCDSSLVRYFEWTGDKYIACQGRVKDGKGYALHVFGRGFHVELTTSTADMKLVPLNTDVHSKCPSLYGEAARVYPVATPDTFEFGDKDWPWMEDADAGRRLASGKECIFFHGTGQSTESPPTSAYTDYWGDIHKSTSQCSSRRFAHFDTKNYGWEDAELQRKHCEVLLGGTGFQGMSTAGQLVENKIIFSHSMGNLILGGAISNNLCQLGNSSSWYESQGPLAGSKGPDVAQDICTGWWDWVTLLVEWVGFCVPTGQSDPVRETSIAYKSMRTNVDFGKAQLAIKENVKGAMCGDTAWGLNSIYSPALQALAAFIWFDGDNDGMVETLLHYLSSLLTFLLLALVHPIQLVPLIFCFLHFTTRLKFHRAVTPWDMTTLTGGGLHTPTTFTTPRLTTKTVHATPRTDGGAMIASPARGTVAGTRMAHTHDSQYRELGTAVPCTRFSVRNSDLKTDFGVAESKRSVTVKPGHLPEGGWRFPVPYHRYIIYIHTAPRRLCF